jgi:hypothetical protein
MPTLKPPERAPDGTPIWGRNKDGKPICNAMVRCQGTVLDEDGCCENHKGCKPARRANGLPFVNKAGKPICGIRDEKSGRCQVSLGLMANGRCEKSGHGGRSGPKHLRDKQTVRTIRTRDAFLDALGGGHLDIVPQLVFALQKLALGTPARDGQPSQPPNLEAIKYVVNQMFGGPTSTIEHKISASTVEILAIVMVPTAKRLGEAELREWYAEVKEGLATHSHSLN